MLNYLIEFRHKHVRDLAWLIGSRSFFSREGNPMFPTQLWFKNELDRHREMLEKLDNVVQIPSFDSLFIGKYFEQLFALWMENSPFYELVCHNRQINGPDGTLSEIDFIVREGNTYTHFETAVKYYLLTGNGEPENWIGPNAHDNLAKKLETVRQRQIPAVQSEYARPILNQLGVTELTSRFFLKGDLFVPFGQTYPDLPDTIHISRDCFWIHYRNIDQIEARQFHWCVAPKEHWMGPVILSPGDLPVSRWPEIIRFLTKHFHSVNKALMIVALDKAHGFFTERFRVMVVPDNWPED